jgi:hypothetical protein
MKKVLVVLLVLAVLMSLSGAALADFRSFKRISPSGATVTGEIDINIEQETEAKARSGRVSSYGNLSANVVKKTSEATAVDDTSNADNSSTVVAANLGDGLATSGPAAAASAATNVESVVVTDIADATVTCSLWEESCSQCGCPQCSNGITGANTQPNGQEHHCNMCECCPATVDGDIDIDVEQETKAEATSGDATAKGNMSLNLICDTDKATAVNGGSANNTSAVTATNTGIATSGSGAATATNIANNSVYTDIYRSATTSRSISMYLRN